MASPLSRPAEANAAVKVVAAVAESVSTKQSGVRTDEARYYYRRASTL